MNFDLSEEQELLRRTVRNFAQRRIAPGASERDEAARFPAELIPAMAELGLLGINIPAQFGGAGLDAVSAAIMTSNASAKPPVGNSRLVSPFGPECTSRVPASPIRSTRPRALRVGATVS